METTSPSNQNKKLLEVCAIDSKQEETPEIAVKKTYIITDYKIIYFTKPKTTTLSSFHLLYIEYLCMF